MGFRERACRTVAGMAVVTLLAGACAAPATPGSDDAGVVVHSRSDQDEYAGNKLDPAWTMPPVTFTDTDGASYHLVKDSRKRVTLLFFGYTHCPDVCPTVIADFASALRRMPEGSRAQVEFVFVTTDPKRDTGPVMREYLDRFDRSFVGLRGPIGDVREAAEPLSVAVEPPRPDPAAGGYATDHGSHVTGFDRNDRGRVLWTPGTPVADLRSDLLRLLAVDSRSGK